MKTLYRSFILFISLLSFEAQAQNYIPFPDSNAMWTNTLEQIYWNGQWAEVYLADVEYFCIGAEDTLINGNTYNKLNICGEGYHGGLRDNGGQVFFVPDSSSTELLIYDFTKSVGDTIFGSNFTWIHGDQWQTVDLVVDQIDSMLIGSDYHKIFYFQNMGSMWIEGVGNSQGLFLEPYANVSNYAVKLNCMSKSDTVLYPIYGIGSCPMDVSVDEFPAFTELQVFPNPTSSSFTVSAENILFSYQLSDLRGRILLDSQEKVSSVEINVENQVPGVYLLTVSSGDFRQTIRILKE